MKNTSINRCIQDAVKVVKKEAAKRRKKLLEPDYTAALTVEFPPFLNAQKIKGIKVMSTF